MVVSTAVSDLALAIACAIGAAALLRASAAADHPERALPRRVAAFAMATMAFAAALGSLRFAGLEQLTPLHRGSAHFAGAVAPASFALVALTAVVSGDRRRLSSLAIAGLAILVLAWALFDPILQQGGLYRTAIGTPAVLLMVVLGLRDRSLPGLVLAIGALVLALAGLVIGSEGTIGPLLAVDVFHVALALAHLAIAHGLIGLAAATDRAGNDRAGGLPSG